MCKKIISIDEKPGFLKAVVLAIFGTALFLSTAGCLPGIKLQPDATVPLREYTLEGTGREKVAVININGMITDKTEEKFMSGKEPSMLQETIAQLKLAEKDPDVKAVVLKINSPGGTITASDILYHRILQYKKATGATIIAALMDVAASGGYYIALPADQIIAHPTTVTGSVGVIFVTPQVYELLDKIGVGVNARVSGRNKDMGSPFRAATEEEDAIFNALIRYYADRFMSLVKLHRDGRGLTVENVETARIFTADGALSAGLIDRIGYLEEAIAAARQMSGLPANARVVVYRRTAYPNDTIYNSLSAQYEGNGPALVNVDLLNALPVCEAGFYYLWWPRAP
ncbi:MAG: signal peptide peptidase SppA [Thermodesulfobacteriota bacterium]